MRFALLASAVLGLSEAWAEEFVFHPTEQPIWDAWQAHKPVEARRLAEARLQTEPDSFVAHFVLGDVLYRDEGNLSRARAELEEANALWENRFSKQYPPPWLVHANLLNTLADVAGDMDDREAELEWFRLHDEKYTPTRDAEYAWAQMKLGRFAEAEQTARTAAASDDPGTAMYGRNSLCAITAERGARQATFDACRDASERVIDGYDPVVEHTNYASAALSVRRFDVTESVLRAATAFPVPEYGNPWLPLTWLYLTQARGVDALGAARAMQRWRAQQPASSRDQSRAEIDTALAAMFYAAGDGERALRTIDRAIQFPDRLGRTSGNAQQYQGARHLMRLAARRLARRAALEEIQVEPFWKRWWAALQHAWPDPEDAVDRAAVAASLSDARRLRATFRVYIEGGIVAPPWWLGDLVPIIGPGVVESELAAVRIDPEDEGMEGYYDALLAECAWWRGGDVATPAASALAGLPEAERMLRARVAALRADAAYRRGDRAAAFESFELAMQLDPGAVRRLGLRLPAEVEGGGSRVAETVVPALRRSPSLVTGDGGFRVRVAASGDVVTVCLTSPSGAQLGCRTTARPPISDGEAPLTDTALAAQVVREFHSSVFGLPVGDGPRELGSLDGTNLAQTTRWREQMRGMLEGLGE